ncbi:hypothetical protein [uncultured Parolsenella sp.]|uniref:hypothetical protein n=1 Tax=uncultured Parolsenella sp. TaxID=2083008 RepID=UPI0025F1F02D|nr:hypothetical protein [uncultured Parolsenella sp.]
MSEGYQPQTPQGGNGAPGQPAPQPQPVPQPQPQPAPAPTPQVPVIESASATTSPDNHSGPGVYVILAIGLALIIASSLVLANTFGEVLSEVADIVAEEYPDEEWDFDDLDHYFDDDTRSTDADLTADNIFETRIGCADESVNSYVYASDYDGSQQAVSEFVFALTKADGDSTNLFSMHLRAAMGATDAATRTEELDAAAQVVADAQASIQAVEVPGTNRVSGVKADSIIDALGDAKEDCAERWGAIAKLVDILRSPDGHTADELAELDEEASNIVDIAIRLTTALTDSASYK